MSTHSSRSIECMAHVVINLPQVDGYPPYSEEELHTTELDEGLHRLDITPTFAMGIAVGDVLCTESVDDGTVWATSVAVQGDHWCSRIVPFGDTTMDSIIAVMTDVGGTAHDSGYGLVAVDFDATVDVEAVIHALEQGRAEECWDFGLGVDPRR